MFKLILALIPAVMLALLAGGCATTAQKQPGSPVPTPEQAVAMREAFLRVSPSAKVGVVSAVLNDLPYAMVADIDTDGLKAGDIVSFVDANETTIAHGKIVQVEASRIAVEFTADSRPPLVGDLAVKF